MLEQVLYENEIEVVDSIEIDTSDGEKLIYAWEDAAEALCINENGELTTFDGNFKSALISIDEAIIDEDRVHITNIPPTVLSALDLPHESMPEEVLITDTYDHVVMIFLDGLFGIPCSGKRFDQFSGNAVNQTSDYCISEDNHR